MKAFQLARVDTQYDMHLQAWLNHSVTATKEQGKKQVPVYKNFKEFFDYEKQIKEVHNPIKNRLTPKQRRMAEIAKKVNSERGRLS